MNWQYLKILREFNFVKSQNFRFAKFEKITDLGQVLYQAIGPHIKNNIFQKKKKISIEKKENIKDVKRIWPQIRIYDFYWRLKKKAKKCN